VASRKTINKCNLFSFGATQAVGITSRWTQNLEPINAHEVKSGETVEMAVSVSSTSYLLDDNTQVRFDILKEDYPLTFSLNDRVTSIVGTRASNPEEGFTIKNVATRFYSIQDGQSLATFIHNFKRTYSDSYQDNILIVGHQREGKQAYLILAWWAAEGVENFIDSALYFTINVEDQFVDKSEEVLRISSLQEIEEEEIITEAPVITGADLVSAPLSENVFDVRWMKDGSSITVALGETIRMEASHETQYTPNNPRFLVLVENLIGHQVASLEPEIGVGVLSSNWNVSIPPGFTGPGKFRLVYSDGDDVVLAGEILELYDTIEATILNEEGEPKSHVAWTAKLIGGDEVYEGVTNQNGLVFHENVIAGHYEIEIEGHILIPDEATRRSTLVAEEFMTQEASEDISHNVIFSLGLSRTGLPSAEISMDPLVQ